LGRIVFEPNEISVAREGANTVELRARLLQEVVRLYFERRRLQIESLIKVYMTQPQVVEIGARSTPADTVKQMIYPVAEDQKTVFLLALLEHVHYESVIVFCRTKNRADRISHLLKVNHHAVAVLHANRTQREREQALKGFRDGKYEVLVATDIASRGLDVPDVSHVINYDVPQHPEDYVHRIGRTGRAQTTGDAFTLMVSEDVPHLAAIEKFIGRTIERSKLENFQYHHTSLFNKPQEKPQSLLRRGFGTRRKTSFFGKRRR
jgi:ATP-dependent RNA helicase RhlE